MRITVDISSNLLAVVDFTEKALLERDIINDIYDAKRAADKEAGIEFNPENVLVDYKYQVWDIKFYQARKRAKKDFVLSGAEYRHLDCEISKHTSAVHTMSYIDYIS